jgi:hypothetical protein
MLDGFVEAIKSRFLTESKNVYNATKILHLASWPQNDLKGLNC